MMNQDLKLFGELMIKMSEVAAGNEDMKRPSKEKIEMYFEALKDLSLEIIHRQAVIHFQREKFFPAICELRPQVDDEVEAQQAFEDIKEAVLNLYDPMLGTAALVAVQEHLKNRDREHLIKMLPSWGAEIAYSEKMGVTRAQFIKAYVAEKKIKLKELAEGREKDTVQIGDLKQKLLKKAS